MSKQKICIIGSNGFVGRNLHRAIRADNSLDQVVLALVDFFPSSESEVHPRDHFVSASSEPVFLTEALKGTTICVNLASKIFAQAETPEELLSVYLEASLSPIHTFFPYMKESLRQWVQLSTISVYKPSQDGSPIRENQALVPINPYGVSKLAADRYLLSANKSIDFALQILRLPDIYGPESRSPSDLRLFPSMQRTFLYGLKSWDVYGTGDERRDMIHIADACEAIICCLKKPVEGIWNVGSGIGVSVNELIAILSNLTNHRPELKQFPEKIQTDHLLNCQKFADDFSFKCRIDFVTGVTEEFNYHRLNGKL